jgi:hypothetical protein
MLSIQDKAAILLAGGIIPTDGENFPFGSVGEYIDKVKEARNKERAANLETFLCGRAARELFATGEGVDPSLSDAKDAAIDVIERYYKPSVPKPSDLISISHSNTGSIKEGVMVKWESYANQFRITIGFILGDYNYDPIDKTFDLEDGAKCATISKAYEGKALPTREELIDDICVYDLLEKMKPIGVIFRDICKINIYPRSKGLTKSQLLAIV